MTSSSSQILSSSPYSVFVMNILEVLDKVLNSENAVFLKSNKLISVLEKIKTEGNTKEIRKKARNVQDSIIEEGQVNETEKQLEQSKEKILSLESRIRTLEESIHNKDERERIQQQEKIDCDQQIIRLNQQIETKENENRQIESRATASEERFHTLEQQCDDKDNQINTLTQEKSNIERQIQQIQEQRDQNNNRIEILTREKTQSEQRAAEQEENIRRLQQQKTFNVQRIEEIQREKTLIEQRSTTAEEQVRILTEEKQQKEQTINSLTNQRSQYEQRSINGEQRIRTIEQQQKELEKKITKLEQEKKQAQEQSRIAEQKQVELDKVKKEADEKVFKAEQAKRQAEENMHLAEERAILAQPGNEQQRKKADELLKRCQIPCSVLKQIGEDLMKGVVGSEEEKKKIKQIQDYDAQLITRTFEQKQDAEGRRRIIQTSVIEGFLLIMEKRELNEIPRNISQAFAEITMTTDEIKLLIYSKKPFPGLLRLLDHSDIFVACDGIGSILNILNGGSYTTPDNQLHPHYETMNACGGIEMIMKLFRKNIDKYSKNVSAICIGHLFRAREINDKQMFVEIIGYLKTLVNESELWTKLNSKCALRYLAQNGINRAEIESGYFVIPD
ncbi:MAG: hypothetical protein EZS28_005034 [Streblomastix strix]|uniref:Uncharacterized protein n=1 Tax=Streblomastix strix TaxID=222440 RepID=A0A5J4WY78_9EUKA|nr:MAG: hypothetical protein EZS28_005034 [Streblomastix strix]